MFLSLCMYSRYSKYEIYQGVVEYATRRANSFHHVLLFATCSLKPDHSCSQNNVLPHFFIKMIIVCFADHQLNQINKDLNLWDCHFKVSYFRMLPPYIHRMSFIIAVTLFTWKPHWLLVLFVCCRPSCERVSDEFHWVSRPSKDDAV